MSGVANALPTKRFFIEMITRDISMEDAILDLIDNAIDAYILNQGIVLTPHDLLDEEHVFLRDKSGEPQLGHVVVELKPGMFSITDRSGGITRKQAEDEVFRFGSESEKHAASLGVYGIGLKRALFKLGNDITVESRTAKEGFRLHFDAQQWEKQLEWKLPLEYIPGAGKKDQAGTTITIRQLHPNVIARINDGSAESRLKRAISETYPFFLNRMVTVSMNGVPVQPATIPLGASEEIHPSVDHFVVDGVDVTLMAGLAVRQQGDWKVDKAGWYVACNGRVVVSADKTELTGWGVSAPQFVSKYRGFIGIAFYFSDSPAKLPWTTTKRGINRESPAYIGSRNRLELAGKPVITFLNKMYPSDPAAEATHRSMAEAVGKASIGTISNAPTSAFRVETRREPPKTTIKVQYDAELADVERVRKRLKKPKMSAGRVGEHTLAYFLEMECS